MDADVSVDPAPWVMDREARRTVAEEQWVRENGRLLTASVAVYGAVAVAAGLLLPDREVALAVAGVAVTAGVVTVFAMAGMYFAASRAVRVDVDAMLRDAWGVDGAVLVNPRSPMPPAPGRGVAFMHAGARLETWTLVNHGGRLLLYGGDGSLVRPAAVDHGSPAPDGTDGGDR